VALQDAPGDRSDPWQERERRARAVALLQEARGEADREDAVVSCCERRIQGAPGQRGDRPGSAGGVVRSCQRRPADQAVHAGCAGSRNADQEAHESCRHRRFGARGETQASSEESGGQEDRCEEDCREEDGQDGQEDRGGEVMGQKTHPIGFRLGVSKNWRSRYYANRDMPAMLKEDALLRKYLHARLGHAAISDVTIERKPGKVVVTIHTGRPGVVIGKKGTEVDQLRDELSRLSGKEVGINVEEIKRPELDAQLVADNIANQLAQRISFRRAMKRAVQSSMRMGAQGIKVKCGGRLGGAEIARVEGYHEGRVPLHTLRADIDYATST